MNFSKLNTVTLRQVLKLSERKEALLKELEQIEKEIFSYLHEANASSGSGLRTTSPTGNHAPSSSVRLGKGMMKQNILQALAEAGEAGLRVPELSKKIHTSSASLHVWFTNVGKKLQEIEKIGAGHFRIRS